MSADIFGMSTVRAEHDVKLTLNGSEENLRQRVVEAVERLSYKVISEQPLQARRAARGSARWDCSFETLDYPRTLTISLKQHNDLATVAAFNYEVKGYSGLTRGDRQTLDYEARAIAALAMRRESALACAACGTPVTGDSRFCRRCGGLLEVDAPELEVLRLMEDTRRGYHKMTSGVVISLIALLLPLMLIWIDTAKAFRVVTMLSATAGVMGLFLLLRGIWLVHRALNPIERDDVTPELPGPSATFQTKALPPRPAGFSVTEGTTEFLTTEDDQRERVPVERKAVDTAEVR